MPLLLDRRLLNVDEYQKMAEVGILEEKGIELIRGEIIKMSPTGSEHAGSVDYLNMILTNQANQNYIIRVQSPIQLNNLSEPEPDIAILKPQDNFYRDRHPQTEDVLAIIEVADSSLAYDQEIKSKLYAETGIPEFYLVNLVLKHIEIYTQLQKEGYAQTKGRRRGEILEMEGLGLRLETKDIFG